MKVYCKHGVVDPDYECLECEQVITVEVLGGCVVDVKGLPEGWVYEIEDHDNEAVE